ERNYQVGTVKYSDVLQWRVKLQQDQTTLSKIENDIKELSGYWQILLGISDRALFPAGLNLADFDNSIKKYAEMDSLETSLELEKFLYKVKQTSAVLSSLDLGNRMMEKNYLLAKGNFLPSLNLQFSYELENDDKFDLSGDENWNLAAVISLPIFSSGDNYTNLKKTKYELESTRLASEYTRDNYLVAAGNTFGRLALRAKVVEDNKTALEFARENHKIINDLYDQGMVTNSELLDAELMLFGSESELLSAYYDFILTEHELNRYYDSKEE
ncbi:MAG: TolC family protein, partial [Candidatus Cloacimonetes bacterium]|nr:TolC family protein [Candidatus Cloacimonadota bacterium]